MSCSLCPWLLLTRGSDDGQAISKKRERQVGEAQGALVVAQAQVSGLEMQLQELTAVHKQASAQHTLLTWDMRPLKSMQAAGQRIWLPEGCLVMLAGFRSNCSG